MMKQAGMLITPPLRKILTRFFLAAIWADFVLFAGEARRPFGQIIG